MAGFCDYSEVLQVIDGDTIVIDHDIDLDGVLERIRLVLVDAPELSESGGPEAKVALSDLCLGVRALIDEDSWQINGDPYGRILAVVYCGVRNANAEMILSGHANTYWQFCAESEFGTQDWTRCYFEDSP